MRYFAFFVVACVCFLAIASADDSATQTVIRQWSSDEVVSGVFISVDDQGVSIRSGDQVIPQIIPWYNVKAIDPKPAGLRAYQSDSDLAWRAHQRLIRGDVSGAEKLYTQLESKYLWKNGPQSLDVALGLFLCRLDRGDRVSAIAPAIAWFTMDSQLHEDGVGLGFDTEYRLFPQLPPVFSLADSPSLNIKDLGERQIRAKILAESYRIAIGQASFHTQSAKEDLNAVLRLAQGLHSNDPGVDLVVEMLICQAHPDADRRASARKKLANKIQSADIAWVEAWARLAIGNSLINEDQPSLNEQGVIELIHVIVRMNDSHPNLAILAATIADEYLSSTDRASWGRELRAKANANQ